MARIGGVVLLAGAWMTSAAGGTAESDPLAAVLGDTLKGEARLSDPPAWPQGSVPLMLAAAERVAGEASAPACGARLASVPMPIGARDQFAAARKAGAGLLSTLASVATGRSLGGGSSAGHGAPASGPPLSKDPIKSKYRNEIRDKPSGIRLDLGAQLAGNDLLLSSRLDSVSGKGTVHEVYLERDDCRRIYPLAEYLYELWGSWSLSVSWTRTDSTYQDGKLLNQQTSSGGFMRTGSWGPGGGSGLSSALDAAFAGVPPELAGAARSYQSALRQEMTLPMWQRLGFAAPTAGARSVGTRFLLSASDLAAIQAGHMAAIVLVTREHGPFYEVVGVPAALAPGKDAHLAFTALNSGAR
jgi:hypothetical protein